MKKKLYLLLVILAACFCFVSCGGDNKENTSEEYFLSDIYAVDKEMLGDWQEGYIKYIQGNESQSCYILSNYNSDDYLRTTYLGQLDKDAEDGYYLFADSDGQIIELRSKDFTYAYDFIFDEGLWNVYDNEGQLVKILEIGKVSMNTGDTRGIMDNIMDIKGLFEKTSLVFRQEWGELVQNIGTDIALKALKLNSWPVQIAIEGVSAVAQADKKWMLYDGCVPQIKSCDNNGKIDVDINGISNLTNIYKIQEYNPLTKEYEMTEKPGKEVSMAVAIKRESDYVTYGNCDNHTTYVKISSSNVEAISVTSPIKFEPGITYYLRPYLIEKTLFDCKSNTERQRYVQYGNTYKFRYTYVAIKNIGNVFVNDYSQSQYAVRLKVSANIESLENVIYWGVKIYDKNNEQLKELQCYSDQGKKDNEFLYDGYLDKSLFQGISTSLKIVPYAKYDDGRYAYGESKQFNISFGGCPDTKHPHAIDLGLPSGTKWACCNVGSSYPEGFGGYYAWGETQIKDIYTFDTYLYGNYDRVADVVYADDIGSDIAGRTTYDAATANWGAPWRMPNITQAKELLDNCTSVYTCKNGVYGQKFTGPNGGTIFLPDAGYYFTSGFVSGAGGCYWLSTLVVDSYPPTAYWLEFRREHGTAHIANYHIYGRAAGNSVRPVCK